MIMKEAIENLKKAIIADYALWNSRMDSDDDLKASRITQFEEELVVEEARKYIKVFTRSGGTIWGFIMKEDDNKFKKGDLLKAASWSAPARNKARGNILTDDYEIRWTGPLYL
ncbi:hypothetical protein N9M52_00785 [bacterium]|nr:hypothetical protein [bacterium]